MKKRHGKSHQRREPSGRPSRAEAELPEPVPPTNAKRMRDAAAQRYGDPQWGTEIGRLWLASKITEPEYKAARRWWEVREAFYRAIDAPPPHEAPGPIGGLGVGGAGRGEDDPPVTTSEGRRLRDQRLRQIDEYERAHLALGSGTDILAAFRLTVEHEQAPVGYVGLSNLRYCLARLARHWGITR